MGLAFPVGGANENFGVLVAVRASKLVDGHEGAAFADRGWDQ